MKKKFYLMAGLLAACILSLVFDKIIYLAVYLASDESLNLIFRFFSHHLFLLASLFIVPSAYMYFKRFRKYIVFHWASLAFSYIISLSFKELFMRPRPYEALSLIPFAGAPSYSFPSAHAAMAFAALPILFAVFPKKKAVFAVTASVIAVSRIFLGVHYLSDIFAGALIGLAAAEIILHFSTHYQGKLRIEINRQFFHLFLGIALAYLLYEKLINAGVMLIILAAGIILSYACTKRKVPFFSYMLDNFDREHGIPGYGTITYFIGVIFCVVFFQAGIALAAILVLAMGDSFSTLAGKLFGRMKNPLNKLKTLEGSLAGFIFAFLGASIFVSPAVAAAGAGAGMIAEAVEHKYLKIDDNLLIPLAAGIVMSLI